MWLCTVNGQLRVSSIDHIYTTAPQLITNIIPVDTEIGDHKLVICDILAKKPIPKPIKTCAPYYPPTTPYIELHAKHCHATPAQFMLYKHSLSLSLSNGVGVSLAQVDPKRWTWTYSTYNCNCNGKAWYLDQSCS